MARAIEEGKISMIQVRVQEGVVVVVVVEVVAISPWFQGVQ